MSLQRKFLRSCVLTVAVLMVFCAWSVTGAFASVLVPQKPLSGAKIPKFVDPLPVFGPAGLARVTGTSLMVDMQEFQQKVLPAAMYPATGQFAAGTYVWGYKVGSFGPLYPAYTIEAQKGIPTNVTYVNSIGNSIVGSGAVRPVLQQYLTVDQTIHWADPLALGHVTPGTLCTPGAIPPVGSPVWCFPYDGPVPAVTHLHGGEVPSESDGGPDAWFTPGYGGVGSAWTGPFPGGVNADQYYIYPNTQEATTLWFHDHALGVTRLNVYGGLAGFYLLRDSRDTGHEPNALSNPNQLGVPGDQYEIEIVIQDRIFDTNGQWLFPDVGINPEHPFWIPEFLGDVIVVNGKTWPFLNVEPRRYRFRFLNGSNARFYNLALPLTGQGQGKGNIVLPFYQIGTDGGLLNFPVMVNQLLIAPGERADAIVDFTNAAGTNIVMTNNARAPFPGGAPAATQTVGQIMQFRVGTTVTNTDLTCNPAAIAGPTACTLRPSPIQNINLGSATVYRQLTLNEVMGKGGPLEILLNNTKWDGTMSPNAGGITELPSNGTTEVWDIINMTADTHPIHVHLVQFQLIHRQAFNLKGYTTAYNAAFPINTTFNPVCTGGVYCPGYGPPSAYGTANTDGAVGGNPALVAGNFLLGAPVGPAANEAGWKDTVRMNPGEVTRIAVQFKPQDGTAFTFDPTLGPGYVWHCHILDHEDNEMMRPYHVQ